MDETVVPIEESVPDLAGLRRLLRRQGGAVARAQIGDAIWGRVRWQLDSDRWQRVHPGLFIGHSGPVTRAQLRWIAVLGGGPGAALCAATAAELAGLTGFETPAVHVSIPAEREGPQLSGVRYHRSRNHAQAVEARRLPPRVGLAHALIAMAATARTESRAHDILTSAVQQRLIRTDALRDVLDAKRNVRGRALMRETLLDIDDGAQSLNEVAMLKVIRKNGLPVPDLQLLAATERRRASIDGGWPQYAVCFEIDGVGHFEVDKWLDDADRQNEVALTQPAGTTLLRWPGFVVRRAPHVVADQACRALERGGWTAEL